MNLIVVCLSLLLTTSFIAWYVPYYNERFVQYQKHEFVLREECWEGKFHPKVQHNKMTYDGLSTNCTEASVFTAVPVWLGAINNMWEGSVFYTLIHATNWQLQVAYAIFGLVISVVGILELSKFVKWNNISKVLTSNNNGGRSEYVDPTNGVKRIIMPMNLVKQNPTSHTNSKDDMTHLAKSLIQRPSLMPKKKKKSLIPPNS